MNRNSISGRSRARAPRRCSRVCAQESRRISPSSSCEGGEGLTVSSVEEHLGLTGWSADGEGIGGVLKVRVEDFRVEEIARIPALDPKGRFTVVRATLNNWETNRYLNRLARACGISRKRVFSSGMKDKRAVTTQILVIDAPQSKVERV
ncbi:MAG: tRNA pseudouridine(13) synthase TruD, partial [Candidatus Poseidoniales archaeon]